MESPEQIVERLRQGLPGGGVEVVTNPSAAAQHSILVGRDWLRAVAEWLRDDPLLSLDFASNVTGVDWLPASVKVKVKRVVDGAEAEIEEVRQMPGYLEVLYHLYSMARKQGPVILRVRTSDRGDGAWVPSLTPVWRSCELQEREIFDLFGVRFEGHPDLRRLLMWEGFADHPMRRDYVEPDDFEYEPTPHDRVLERAAAHRAGGGTAGGATP